jgi:hypothetical protein
VDKIRTDIYKKPSDSDTAYNDWCPQNKADSDIKNKD